ncbi:MAG: Uma2 family endonuclease [Chloroflexi bacterium]|nr:Uma2 family endonuclease [Chloroflexota bacterium]
MIAKLKPSPLKPVRHPDDDLTIHYPETDSMPLPDGRYREPLFVEVVSTLEAYLTLKYTDVEVSGNTFIYYEMNNPRRSVSPDCYVSFGVDVDAIMEQNSYIIWRVGKPPDFALEIASESTGRYDDTGKRDLYASLGFGEYWRYDSTGGRFYQRPLVGERLVNGEYQEFAIHEEPDGMIWAHSPTLGLDLCWDNGRLRFYDPETGEWLQNYAEQRQRADAAEARIRELEEQLRQAGIDPSV